MNTDTNCEVLVLTLIGFDISAWKLIDINLHMEIKRYTRTEINVLRSNPTIKTVMKQ